ncbi:MAG: filamentous hemagglutinin N-terminal domain-containing protein, partial [Acidimicrobiia bacterium]
MNRTYLNRTHRIYLQWSALGLWGVLLPCPADITLDGTMGPGGALSGPDFQIGAELGRQVGSNLFHSFGVFNINSPESATFSGPDAIDNILGRVTGGSASTIDGLLRSTISEANLFFLNPAGVVFGPNASLDVQGAFHASTADLIRLEDGVQFTATPSAQDPLLTTAPPEAFGFLGDNPAAINVIRSDLEVPAGERLSLVGGNVFVTSGRLAAPSGRIDLVSVASAGEVATNAIPDVQSFDRLGQIEITQIPVPGAPGSSVEVRGEGGQGIFIRGGIFTLAGGSRVSSTTDDSSVRPGAPISIQAEDVTLD